MLVDDHTVVREGLRSILELEPDIRVVGEAADAASAVRVTQRSSPDIVVLDLSLGRGDPPEGLRLCEQLIERFPEVKVVVLTAFADPSLLASALRAGAKGYVLKDVDLEELVRILRAVNEGGSGFDSRSASLVARALAAPTEPVPLLTMRETEVLRLLAAGLTNREVGARTFLSESTVKFHLRGAMAKLGVHRRAEAVYVASRLGLL
ncbi:MAG: response regulator transcription factor [Actinomycetes bacterium]